MLNLNKLLVLDPVVINSEGEDPKGHIAAILGASPIVAIS